MTSRYFVSMEASTPELTKIVLPGAEKYGFETVIAISENFKFDIEAINLASQVGSCFKGHEGYEEKYNVKFFPDLPQEFTFGDKSIDDFDTREEFIENSFVLKMTNVIVDDEREACVAACIRPSENPITEMINGADHHFTKQNVSTKVVLN